MKKFTFLFETLFSCWFVLLYLILRQAKILSVLNYKSSFKILRLLIVFLGAKFSRLLNYLEVIHKLVLNFEAVNRVHLTKQNITRLEEVASYRTLKVVKTERVIKKSLSPDGTLRNQKPYGIYLTLFPFYCVLRRVFDTFQFTIRILPF